VSVPDRPGMGFDLDHEFLDAVTTASVTIAAG
jgi:hypothetical protein